MSIAYKQIKYKNLKKFNSIQLIQTLFIVNYTIALLWVCGKYARVALTECSWKSTVSARACKVRTVLSLTPNSEQLQKCLIFWMYIEMNFYINATEFTWQAVWSTAQHLILALQELAHMLWRSESLGNLIKVQVNGFLGAMGQGRGGGKNLNSSPLSCEK